MNVARSSGFMAAGWIVLIYRSRPAGHVAAEVFVIQYREKVQPAIATHTSCGGGAMH
jgi:hypothetical protein